MHASAPGAAKELARRVGGFVREGDVDRQRQGALAVGELEKLALYRPFDPVSEDDVRALVAEVVPDSTWAFLDAVAERKVAVAAPLLDRLLETTPEPVLLVQLHRRIRELIEVADHLAAGATPGSLVRTLGMKPFRVDKLVGQARRWRVAELDDALEGLLDLDATVKGAPDSGATDAQRRLAFTLWMRERVAPAAPPRAAAERRRRRSVRGGPGLFLQDDVALDREHAAAVGEVEQLDQLRVDVQLVAVLAQPARDPEAQPLGAVRQPERRVEAGDDEAPAAAGAAISQARHRGSPVSWRDPAVDDLPGMLGTVRCAGT